MLCQWLLRLLITPTDVLVSARCAVRTSSVGWLLLQTCNVLNKAIAWDRFELILFKAALKTHPSLLGSWPTSGPLLPRRSLPLRLGAAHTAAIKERLVHTGKRNTPPLIGMVPVLCSGLISYVSKKCDHHTDAACFVCSHWVRFPFTSPFAVIERLHALITPTNIVKSVISPSWKNKWYLWSWC